MIRYYKLFDLLNRRGMKKSDLRQILSPKTVAKLSKGEYISGEAIEKICLFLECQPGDIMEIINTTSDMKMDKQDKSKSVIETLVDISTNKNMSFSEKAKASFKAGMDLVNPPE